VRPSRLPSRRISSSVLIERRITEFDVTYGGPQFVNRPQDAGGQVSQNDRRVIKRNCPPCDVRHCALGEICAGLTGDPSGFGLAPEERSFFKQANFGG
jgi:hypothetical protein